MSNKNSVSLRFLNFLTKKFSSNKLRKIILFILFAYVSVKILKKLYKKKYDKVKYVTLKQILESSKKYDFIVIGSGTSGSCVAGLLTRDERRPNVLLIEAGKPDCYHPLSSEVIPCLSRNNQKTDKDWQYITKSQKGCNLLKDKGSAWPRGKICGGSSILNYMVYVRGNPEDYNEWSKKYKCNGWSWKELVPIFKSFENVLFKVKNQKDIDVRGFNGLQKISRKSDKNQWKLSKLFIQAAQNCGYKYNDDYNGVNPDGVSYTQYNIDENGRRLTSFRSFIATLFDDNNNNNYNIDILPNAQVTKILCRDNIAFGIEINNNSSQCIYINEDNNGEIIISCGSIGTPHLLLLSGIGDKDELKKHNIKIQENVPGVGKNLRDHIMQAFRVIFRNKKLRNTPGIIHEGGFKHIWNYFSEYIFYGKGPLTTTGLDAQIFTKSSIAKKRGLLSNDLQLVQVLIGETSNRRKGAENASKYFNWDIQKNDTSLWGFNTKINNDEINKSIMAVIMNVRPQSFGTISLKSSNPFIDPIIDPGYLQNEDDLKVLLEGWKMLEDIYKKEPFLSMGAEFVTFSQFSTRKEMAEYLFKNYLLTIYHPVGSAKMGNLNDDKYAVCSERLKVRGFNNLRIADASIAPDLISGNTQAMCYVIGCKAAKMILEDWTCS